VARRKRPFTPFVGSTLRPVPELPEAATLVELGLPFTDTELLHIRTAMALHKASRQPMLTWDGWKAIGLALSIGEFRAKQHADHVVTSRGPYGQAVSQFLNATGFAFINKGVRWALRQCIDHLDEVEAWRDALDPNDRAHLNNPIDVWDRYLADQRTPKSKGKAPPATRQRRGYPSLLEELEALQDALHASEQTRDMLEATLSDVLGSVSTETAARLPDALLRKVFAKLPQPVQDALHGRLYPAN
jgi:hypothetical protein